MSNWITITKANLQAGGNEAIIAAAEAMGTDEADPLAEAITDAISTVRGAVSNGNQLDRDTTKIPASLKGLTKRLALAAIKSLLEFDLTTDQRDKAKADTSYLNRIIDQKIRFELPDDPAGSGEMQPGMSVGIVIATNRQATRSQLSGL